MQKNAENIEKSRNMRKYWHIFKKSIEKNFRLQRSYGKILCVLFFYLTFHISEELKAVPVYDRSVDGPRQKLNSIL